MADFLRFRDDEPLEQPAVTLDAFLEQPDSTAVRVEAGDDVRQLIPYIDRLKLVEVSFPRFRDGRGYSSAQILRENGYKGELRAEGDVLVDQLLFMRRVGFDSFAPFAPMDAKVVEEALSRFDNVYQTAADHAVPVWKLRHG